MFPSALTACSKVDCTTGRRCSHFSVVNTNGLSRKCKIHSFGTGFNNGLIRRNECVSIYGLLLCDINGVNIKVLEGV